MRLFRNDYSEGAAPEVLEALIATNSEQWPGYSETGDEHCERARDLIREACGREDIDVEFAIGGTSANVICLTGLLRDWEGVICSPDAHILVHETGALANHGRTLLPTRDTDGFVSVAEAERVWQTQTSCGRHMTKPAALYLSNTTELGGVWSRTRFDEVCDWADSHNIAVFVDGARLAQGLASPAAEGLDLAHLAKRAAAFTIGGTKNGLLMGEAVIINSPRLKKAFPYLIKEQGGLLAKGRLLGVQFSALMSPATTSAPQGEKNVPLWLALGRQANECAVRLREGLVTLGLRAYGDSSSNQQFFQVSPACAAALEELAGAERFVTLPSGEVVARLVCSWATTTHDVDELVAAVAARNLT